MFQCGGRNLRLLRLQMYKWEGVRRLLSAPLCYLIFPVNLEDKYYFILSEFEAQEGYIVSRLFSGNHPQEEGTFLTL